MSFARSSVSRGALLTIAMRWTDRLVGIVSTLILARLLTPDDFGVIAMALIAVGLADVLMDLGVNVALIQNRNATQAHYDTAFTLRLIQTTLATALLFAVAPLAAEYFQDPRVAPVLQCLAFTLLLAGLENIGIVALHKNMQFGAEFRFLFARRIAEFTLTIAAALWLRSYWALVVGTLAGRTVGVGLSYAMHPMRPRLSLERFREIFAVSQWMLVRGIGEFFHNNLHRMLVGRWAPTPTMGAYTLADEISVLPSAELLAPINRALFPALAEAKDRSDALKRMFLLAQSIQTLIAIPAAVGLALVAEEAVVVLLGEKWRLAVPFVQVLALVAIAHAITSCGGYVLLVLGRMRSVTLVTWSQVALFAALALTLLRGGEALEIAGLRLAVAAAGIGLSLWLILRALPSVRIGELAAASIRPLAAAAVMTFAVTALGQAEELGPALLLVAKIGLGLLTYPAAVLALWWLAGRPAGAESWLLERLHTLRRRRTGKPTSAG